ncbi:MAG: ATP-binding protein, partial [Ktedonobacterales bacterium]
VTPRPIQNGQSGDVEVGDVSKSGSRLTRPHTSRPTADETHVVVRGDADRLRQLTLILLDNALRYTPQGGAVHVTARRAPRGWEHGHRLHGDQATLSIADTGVGIASEHLPHLFEPFYRAAPQPPSVANASVRSGGTGLGLAVADWIARAHGGSITATSTVDKGSVFTVTLPLAAMPPHTATHAKAGA